MAKKKRGRHNNRVQRSENAEDLISQLPKDVIETILGRVPIQDAVRTSVLSKKWRYNWTSIRKLTFDKSFFETIKCYMEEEEEEEESPHYNHAEIVHDILLQHRGSLDTFFLHVSLGDYEGEWEYPKTRDLHDRSLHLVSNKGVKDCTILNRDGDNLSCEDVVVKAFPALFSCSEITRLEVDNFVVSIPSTFRGFANLVRLKFVSVLFCGESLQFMTSTCPRLQYLTLSYCQVPSAGDDDDSMTLNVGSSNLKHLELAPGLLSCINFDTNILETLSVDLSDDDYMPISISPLTTLDCLKSLEIAYGHSSYQETIVCLFRSAPNLLELKMDLALDPEFDHMVEIAKFWEVRNSQVMLKRLKLLKIKLLCCSEEELFLLKVLLARTPALEKIDVVDSWMGQKSLSKLAQYPRASPMAKLVSEGVAIDW